MNESDPDGTDPPDPDQCGLPNDGDLGMRTAHPGMHAGTPQSNKARAMNKSLIVVLVGAAFGVLNLEGKLGEALVDGVQALKATRLSSVSKVGGRWPINSVYAGKAFPLSPEIAAKYPAGVRFTADGFPDFSPYSIKTVKVQGLIGDASKDFDLANKAAGFRRTPQNYTWHHHQDGETMQLVPTDLHQDVRHTGGAAIIRSK